VKHLQRRDNMHAGPVSDGGSVAGTAHTTGDERAFTTCGFVNTTFSACIRLRSFNTSMTKSAVRVDSCVQGTKSRHA
jgi:hypothetical protein